jgi:hypothetical protein
LLPRFFGRNSPLTEANPTLLVCLFFEPFRKREHGLNIPAMCSAVNADFT